MSIIYEARCNECGEFVAVTRYKLDGDEDLCIEVEPCDTCLDNRFEEGKEEERKENT